MSSTSNASLSYRALANQSWPIILANAAVPLLGLVDTAVIGHYGSVSELAALAMAALIFSFVYWGFGFLRMGTTGFVARAEGENNQQALMKVIVQSGILAIGISVLIILSQVLILFVSLRVLAAPIDIVDSIKAYFHIRVWGAPATLLQYVMLGVFIGLGDSRKILILQLYLNISNGVLDVFFSGALGLGIRGVALGTVIAEYSTLALAVFLLSKKFPLLNYLREIKWVSLFKGMSELVSQNRDIFIRTFFLLLSFAFFARTGGGFGKVTLAANHILLQLVSFCAFFLDGFAYVLESHSGKAIGKGSLSYLNTALKKILLIASTTALFLACMILFVGSDAVGLLTNKTDVIELANRFLPFVSVYVAVSVVAYILDGVFIGAGYTSAMRDCSIVSTLGFGLIWFLFLVPFEALGLWVAFIAYVGFRGLSLYLFLPKLRLRCTESNV